MPSDGNRLVLRSKCENNEANNRERYIFTWLPSKSLREHLSRVVFNK